MSFVHPDSSSPTSSDAIMDASHPRLSSFSRRQPDPCTAVDFRLGHIEDTLESSHHTLTDHIQLMTDRLEVLVETLTQHSEKLAILTERLTAHEQRFGWVEKLLWSLIGAFVAFAGSVIGWALQHVATT